MGTLNKHGYQQLIDQNIEALEKYMPKYSLEKRHTIEVLRWSIKQLYERNSNQANSENTNCAIFDVMLSCPKCKGKNIMQRSDGVIGCVDCFHSWRHEA